MSPKVEQAQGMDWLRRMTNKIGEQDEPRVTEDVASASQVEAWLQRRGVQFAPATGIPMHMIDEKRSRANQARRDPLVSESIDRFQAALKAGRTFPPIVVYAVGNKLIIVDGNNRHEAAKRQKREYIYGIIIDDRTDSDLIQLLTVEANTGHGVTPPVEWRIRQAFHLVSIGHSDEMSAEAAGITIQQLRLARGAAEADSRAKILRINGFTDLPATSKQTLNVIKNEPVFFAAGKLAADHKLNIEQVRDMCRAIKTGRTESEQLSIVAEQHKLLIAENAAKKALTKRVNSPKNALVAGIGLLQNCDPKALVAQIRTVNDRNVIRKRLEEVVNKILEIQVEMEQLDDMEEE